MLEITNQELFGKVIADALAQVDLTARDAPAKKRWINAISKAVVEIEENGVFMTWMDDSQSLLIWSQKSNQLYSANGVCSCRAFEQLRNYADRKMNVHCSPSLASRIQTLN